MTAILPLLIMVCVFSSVSALNKARKNQVGKQQFTTHKNRAEAERVMETVQPEAATSEKREVHEGADPCHGDIWSDNGISFEDFHEGEDPCHDDIKPVETNILVEETETVSEEAREMLRGIIWSEILTRKHR